MRTNRLRVHRALTAVWILVVLVSTGCGDDIVYKERPPFNPPPDSLAGFLGYYDAASGFTTCGNCHADLQAAWSATDHAGAWETLQASGHAQSVCEPCHTVSHNGNTAVAPAGYAALTANTDERPDSAQLAVYHDVQCESCHGPGAEHIATPSAVQPLASGLVTPDGCGDCHSGAHHPFVEQWSQSKHAIGSGFSRGNSAGCDECHNGKGALVQQFGVTADYRNKDDGEVMPHTCIVCHDPHSRAVPSQLRAPVTEATTRNLCIKCHNRRSIPDGGHRGPHAAQGPLVLGENVGWWPPGFEWLNGLTGSHGDAAANPRLCATCHVEMFEVTDAENNFVFQSVGHLFEAVPCVDGDGVPIAGGECAASERRFTACAVCHSSPTVARNLYVASIAEFNALLDQIWQDVNGNAIIDPAPTDGGVLAQILQVTADPKQIDMGDTLFTAAEGILYNAQLAATHERDVFLDGATIVGTDTVGFSGHFAAGNGIHNPPFLESLLKASIQHAIDAYGLPAPAGVDLTLPAAALARKP
ncbi:MAG: hypothetical protein AMS20_04265 [Gemmatimonas sp. SG8_28]|nr:MAG: hypothetical protein AMS20_04265 [Gemmatimonas sp. SG8_28]